jgi:GxxExxY protein
MEHSFNHRHSDITKLIIEGFFNVYNKLGFGFLESVYEKALMFELAKNGLRCSRQFPIKVLYDSMNVGNYFADILVNDSVVIEIKAAASLCEDHEKQLINYLKATEIEVGLLLNFGVKPQFKRKVFAREFKS